MVSELSVWFLDQVCASTFVLSGVSFGTCHVVTGPFGAPDCLSSWTAFGFMVSIHETDDETTPLSSTRSGTSVNEEANQEQWHSDWMGSDEPVPYSSWSSSTSGTLSISWEQPSQVQRTTSLSDLFSPMICGWLHKTQVFAESRKVCCLAVACSLDDTWADNQGSCRRQELPSYCLEPTKV